MMKGETLETLNPSFLWISPTQCEIIVNVKYKDGIRQFSGYV